MKAHTLHAALRTELGRKVKSLRKSGQIPATIYGKKADTKSISVDAVDFKQIFIAAGETGLVELVLSDKKLPVLIHTVQRDPLSNGILHVEFHQVDLKEKVKTNVPLVLVGESPAIAQKIGVLLTVLSEVEVEALPTELPDKIEVDVASLSEIDQELKVSDLHIPHGVTILSEPVLTVVKVGALVSKEAEEQAAKEQAAATPVEGDSTAPTQDTEQPATQNPQAEASK